MIRVAQIGMFAPIPIIGLIWGELEIVVYVKTNQQRHKNEEYVKGWSVFVRVNHNSAIYKSLSAYNARNISYSHKLIKINQAVHQDNELANNANLLYLKTNSISAIFFIKLGQGGIEVYQHKIIKYLSQGGEMGNINNLDAIFKPGSVALVGASATAGKLGYDVLYNLINAGFSGPIYPINPKIDQILGLTVYKSVKDIPTPPDLAVILIPAKAVSGAIQQCGEAGIKAAVVITGGFAEAGEEGGKLQEELTSTARKYGVRVVGPNCQGVNNPHHNLCASWPLLTQKGRMAFISQSGTVGAALMDWASEDKLGVSVFVSLGNRADVDESDAIRYFNQDPNTRVISLYIEGVKRPEYFLESLVQAKKPIVVLKSGRTLKGRAAAESHTKSLAGTDAVYDAIFKKYKVHRADTLEELYDYSKALAYMVKPKGKRLLNITSSGGSAILAIDAAEKLGFELPQPSQAMKEKLTAILPAHCHVGNPIDLTGDAIFDPTLYSRVIENARGEYDTMVVIFGDPIRGASQLVTPGESEVVVFLGGADVEREERVLIHQRNIPVFPTPERGLKAFYQLFRFDAVSEKVESPLVAESSLRLLPADEAVNLAKKYGIPAVAASVAKNSEEAVRLAKDVGFPVVLKVVSPDISHKSDVGGVRLGVSSDEEVLRAFDDILSNVKSKAPAAKIEGVTVSPMAKSGGLEVIAGIITDPQYGHVLMFGMGGIFAEVYRDVQFCMLPATEDELMQVMKEVKGYPLLTGIRGQASKDQAALLELLKSLALMVKENPMLDQVELNPILVYEKGVVAVDVRIYTRS